MDGSYRPPSSFFSFVFWKSDNRTRQLIKLGEAAMRFLDGAHDLPEEQDGKPHVLRLFEREAADSAEFGLWPLSSGHFSYARCFRWMFLMFAAVGMTIASVCLFRGVAQGRVQFAGRGRRTCPRFQGPLLTSVLTLKWPMCRFRDDRNAAETVNRTAKFELRQSLQSESTDPTADWSLGPFHYP